MARRNMSKSATPGRALSTISRSNTPATVQSNQVSMSPGNNSDKENQTARVDKGKGRMLPPGNMPTPNSDSTSDSRGAKRRRTEESEATPSARRARTEEPDDEGDEEEENGEDDEDDVEAAQPSQQQVKEPASIQYYDPGQDEAERRNVKRKSRALEREFMENREDYLQSNDNTGLQRTIETANEIFREVKQTSEATLDSRLMVNVSDLTYKKSAQLVLGDTSTGLDVDEFVSKCIFFMRQGGSANDDDDAPGSTQRRRRRLDDNDDELEEGETMLDWEVFGARACLPHNVRPALPGFLLGPLSVQKRVRAPTQRRARQQKDAGGREVRPEALTKEDLQTGDNNTVRTICTNIMSRLSQHCHDATAAVQEAADSIAEDDDIAPLMQEYRITETGGPSLFDFVINPHSFGQTVENLFYVSFLIKEGEVGIQMDGEGLPTLLPNTEGIGEARQRNASKHQAVFGLDYRTWQELLEAFEIEEPLIPHRQVEQATQVGQRGWYN